MDIQEIVTAAIAAQRENRMRDSYQWTLGKLIAELEKCELKTNDGNFKTVDFDFGSAIPTHLDSWRGSYAELALGYKLSGRDASECGEKSITIDKLLANLRSGVGGVYEGWKGGDFTMSESTPVWVSNPGDSGNTGVVGVLDIGYSIVILTAFCEY